MTRSIAKVAHLGTEVGRAFYGDFQALTDVQQDAIGPVLGGDDVLIVSRTGSGKTEAILAPLVQRHLLDAPRPAGGPGILYVTPTRALGNDLQRRLSPALERLGLTLGVRHGERNDLRKVQKPELLITTPESLDVMIMSREPALGSLQAVIIDEGHLFYNSQRGFQLAVLLRRLEARNGPVQVAGLSATVAEPAAIWAFLRPGHSVKVIRDLGARDIDFHLRVIDARREIAPIVDRLGTAPRAKVLVFVNSRRECDAVASELMSRTVFGSEVYVHHSSLSKTRRLDAEAAFGASARAICIATSTLELGIDIGDIDLVVLYGHPGGWESFLQRIGRGNRRSNKSVVLAVVCSADTSEFFATLAFEALMHQIRHGRFEREAPMTLLGAGVQQLLSLLLETDGAYRRVDELSGHFAPWPIYDDATVEQMLDGLVSGGFIRRHDAKKRVGASEGIHRLRDLRLVWGNFPSRSREIRLRSGNRDVGAVPAVNLLRLGSGSVITFGGTRWRVRRVRPDVVDLEPTSVTATMQLTYGGVRPRLDPHNVEGMMDFILSGSHPEGLATAHDARFRQSLEDLRRHFQPGILPVQRSSTGRHCYFTFAGRVVNEVIARWCHSSLFEAGDVYLEMAEPFDPSRLPTSPGDLEGIAAEVLGLPADLTMFQSLLPPALLARELAQLWSQSGLVDRTLTRLRNADLIHVSAGTLDQLKI